MRGLELPRRAAAWGLPRRRTSSNTATTTTTTVEDVLSKENESRCKAQLAAMSHARAEASPAAAADDGMSPPPGRRLRKAAVLVPLCTVNCQPSILFTLRSNKLYSHRGEVSFPGGMMEPKDSSIISAALRESFEELGLPPQVVNVWGTMPALPSRDGLTMVTPVIGNVGAIDVQHMQLNYDEVECVFTRNIQSLCTPKNVGTTTFRSKQSHTLPVFLGGEHRIWGLTAYILHQTLTVIAPGMYKLSLPKRHAIMQLKSSETIEGHSKASSAGSRVDVKHAYNITCSKPPPVLGPCCVKM